MSVLPGLIAAAARGDYEGCGLLTEDLSRDELRSLTLNLSLSLAELVAFARDADDETLQAAMRRWALDSAVAAGPVPVREAALGLGVVLRGAPDESETGEPGPVTEEAAGSAWRGLRMAVGARLHWLALAVLPVDH